MLIECPHCKDFILIESINCGIFRHAVMKNNFEQINPHSSKSVCDELVAKDVIFGCGKPFRIMKNGDTLNVTICDYI